MLIMILRKSLNLSESLFSHINSEGAAVDSNLQLAIKKKIYIYESLKMTRWFPEVSIRDRID